MIGVFPRKYILKTVKATVGQNFILFSSFYTIFSSCADSWYANLLMILQKCLQMIFRTLLNKLRNRISKPSTLFIFASYLGWTLDSERKFTQLFKNHPFLIDKKKLHRKLLIIVHSPQDHRKLPYVVYLVRLECL